MSLTQDDTRALDALRQRLSQLSQSLTTLKRELETSQSLPTWPSIHQSSSLLAGHLNNINAVMAKHEELLKSAHAYPNASYPGHVHEGLLNQLLRKKLEPGVDGWIEGGLKSNQVGEGDGGNGSGDIGGGNSRELALHALRTASSTKEKFEDEGLWDMDYTIGEIEEGSDAMARIQAGFKRTLVGATDQESDEGDEDEVMGDGHGTDDAMPQDRTDEAMKGINPKKSPIPLETMLKFMSSGELPPGLAGA